MRLRMRGNLSGAVAALALLATACSAPFATNTYVFKGLTLESPSSVPEFRLQNQHLQSVQVSDFRGSAVLLYFGFTNCPDECPLTMLKWDSLARELGPEADRVRFVMVTVDPERDTPARMKEFLGSYNPAFIGLTGSLEEIEEVTLSFQAFFRKVAGASDSDYLVSHSTLVHVLDPKGRMVLVFPPEMAAREMAADLRHILEQSRSGSQVNGRGQRTVLDWLRKAPADDHHNPEADHHK